MMRPSPSCKCSVTGLQMLSLCSVMRQVCGLHGPGNTGSLCAWVNATSNESCLSSNTRTLQSRHSAGQFPAVKALCWPRARPQASYGTCRHHECNACASLGLGAKCLTRIWTALSQESEHDTGMRGHLQQRGRLLWRKCCSAAAHGPQGLFAESLPLFE